MDSISNRDGGTETFEPLKERASRLVVPHRFIGHFEPSRFAHENSTGTAGRAGKGRGTKLRALPTPATRGQTDNGV